MKKIKILAALSLMIVLTQFVNAQSIFIESFNNSTSSIEISTIESIVFDNNNMVFNTTNCEDNYYNIFLNKKISFNESSDVENIQGESISISVYPNPAKNSLTIKRESNDYANAVIYNLVGNTIMSCNLNSNLHTIDISTLPEGLYFLSINKQSIKFIKQ